MPNSRRCQVRADGKLLLAKPRRQIFARHFPAKRAGPNRAPSPPATAARRRSHWPTSRREFAGTSGTWGAQTRAYTYRCNNQFASSAARPATGAVATRTATSTRSRKSSSLRRFRLRRASGSSGNARPPSGGPARSAQNRFAIGALRGRARRPAALAWWDGGPARSAQNRFAIGALRERARRPAALACRTRQDDREVVGGSDRLLTYLRYARGAPEAAA